MRTAIHSTQLPRMAFGTLWVLRSIAIGAAASVIIIPWALTGAVYRLAVDNFESKLTRKKHVPKTIKPERK